MGISGASKQISVANSREIPSFDYLNKILKNDGGVCGSTCAEFNSMLSQLILDLEVVRSLVSQNGQKIGKIETDIINKSQENQNAHQDIEDRLSTSISTNSNSISQLETDVERIDNSL